MLMTGAEERLSGGWNLQKLPGIDPAPAEVVLLSQAIHGRAVSLRDIPKGVPVSNPVLLDLRRSHPGLGRRGGSAASTYRA